MTDPTCRHLASITPNTKADPTGRAEPVAGEYLGVAYDAAVGGVTRAVGPEPVGRTGGVCERSSPPLAFARRRSRAAFVVEGEVPADFGLASAFGFAGAFGFFADAARSATMWCSHQTEAFRVSVAGRTVLPQS